MAIFSCFLPRDTTYIYYLNDKAVKVVDRTNDRAKALFREDLTGKNHVTTCEIKINDNALITATTTKFEGKATFFLLNSKKISLKKENDETNKFIRIKHIDQAGKKRIFYADYKSSLDGGAYNVYPYKPEVLPEADVKTKLLLAIDDNPKIGFTLMAHNRHGIALFGYEKEANEYVLYWASPEDKQLKKIKCETINRWNDGGTSLAKSQDGFVNFSYYTDSEEYYLNSERATPIFMKMEKKPSKYAFKE